MNCISPGLIWGPIVYGSFHDNEEMMVRPHAPLLLFLLLPMLL